MSERLGIKIEGPVRIGIEPPAGSGLSAWYTFFLFFSFLAIGLALVILLADLLRWPFSDTIYDLFTQWTKGIPSNF